MRTGMLGIAMLAGGCYVVSMLAAHAQTGPKPGLPLPGGRVIGQIDHIRFEGDQFHLWGWACQQGSGASITVEVFADHSAGDTPRGTFVMSGSANVESEPAVQRNCGDNAGGKHRFAIDIPNQLLATFQDRKVFMNGVRVGGGVIDGTALTRSGELQFPKPPVFRSEATTYPPLSGSYRSRAQHPRVFMTADDLSDMAARINAPGTFSARAFARLANQIEHDVTAKADWNAAYSGCEVDVYLHGFAIEAPPFYASDMGSVAFLRGAMSIAPGVLPPRGAAIVASRLSLYAALLKAGAKAPADGPTAEQVTALAKRIMLAWADRGFRDDHGSFPRPASQYCQAGRPVLPTLTLSRGVVYSVQAQDLLMELGALDRDEEARLNRFHGAMADLIRPLTNQEFAGVRRWKFPDEAYNNQVAAHLAAQLALARLLDDERHFLAALYGGEGAESVSIPWVALFDHVVYGPSDHPLIRITPNNGPDSLTSRPAWTTPVVAAGEINDRYRNDNPLQGIGYPMGTLEWLFDAAEILRIAGFDAYGYRGAHQQSIEMASQYYACYGQQAGFYKTVTRDNAEACPDHAEYVGRIVNDVEPSVLIGAYRYPQNASITAAEAAARTAWPSATSSLDAVRFGRWRD